MKHIIVRITWISAKVDTSVIVFISICTSQIELKNILQSVLFLPFVYFSGGAACIAVVQWAFEIL